jgi:hypothetical protein
MIDRGARLRIAAWSALALGTLAPNATAQTLSPGPLAEAHADLDDDSQCSSCHTQGKQVADGKCLSCHTALAATLQAGAGLHGTAYREKPCAQCHVEHIGRKARLVRWPGGAPEKLDHSQTGWPLTGAHGGKACARCHDARTRSGRPTFLGAKTACAGCHRDPHEGRFGGGCASCHRDTSWAEVRLEAFDHAKTRFALAGKHAQAGCRGCHGEPARWTGLRFGACSDCHRDPHAGKFARFACGNCHVERSWKELSGFDTRHPGLPLSEGHARVACARCHDRGNEKAPSKGTTCTSCHQPVHAARFGNDCNHCHGQIRWLGLRREVGLAAHDKTRYPLAGKHVEVACAACHDPRRPAAQRFRALRFDRCTACHADRHAGEFAARDQGDCAACHAVEGYYPVRFGMALHQSTRFPLEGAHQAAPCLACHPGKRPRLDLRVAKQACADCHPNPHGDQFAVEMAAGGCARCHTVADWRQAKVDHSTWPLTGAHDRTACARCHGAVAGRGPGRSVTFTAAQFRGVPRSCEGCHADSHAGQFRLNQPVRACEFCHGTETFAVAAFDHAGKAGYALEGKHARLPCSGCHPSEALRNGDHAVRWRLGYRACKACHADPHGGA